ncbi:hypothetical protein BIW11_01811 [Tropilaelaps mercedesae]|uniref:Ig-like domain-containing protein n=1 Tax=Tropilaelaps mercedesae TaxID=418985 RepID=A0A1V9X8A4_9ACAR|nr:hypothetical protein BIW11_01811 [Tropilaelaps mercedesae]
MSLVVVRYLLTRGWGFYGYYYNRSGRDYQPSAKNVDPFPGKFLGLGSVHYLRGSYDVELHCNFSKDGNKLVSNVVWVKVERAYRQISYGPPNVFVTNPYFCPAGGCIYRDIDTSDKRFFADMHGEVATLHIYDLEPRDYGVYRCSATAKASNGLPGDTEAIYEIVELFT